MFITRGRAVYTSFRSVLPSRASAVASCGDTAVTTTSCDTAPTSIVTLRPTAAERIHDQAFLDERLEAVERDRQTILARRERSDRIHTGIGRLPCRRHPCGDMGGRDGRARQRALR